MTKAQRIAEVTNEYHNDCDRLETFYNSFPAFYNGQNMMKAQLDAQEKLNAEYEAKIKQIESEAGE